MTQVISVTDSRLTWAGAASVAYENNAAMPWRIEHIARKLFHSELANRAVMPAGVRLSFRSTTTILEGTTTTDDEAPALDICCNGELIESVVLQGKSTFYVEGLPDGDKLIELWLPHFGELRLHELAIEKGTTLTVHTDDRPHWITYGSSITQCRAAPTATQTWPAIVARNHDLNLTCLGFGGQCHLDTLIARQIRDTRADYISLCVGINIYGKGSLNPRSFGSSICGFVQIIREKHPDTPLVLMSPIFSPGREETRNSAEFTLSEMRTEVKTAVRTMQLMGDQNIHYIDGLSIFDADQAHLLPDDLHPNAEGYRVMAQRISELVVKPYFQLP